MEGIENEDGVLFAEVEEGTPLTDSLALDSEPDEIISDDVDSIFEAIDSLGLLDETEELVVTSIKNEEGLDGYASESVRLILESIGGRLGIDVSNQTSFSTESFKNKETRLEQTQALEGAITSFISKLWKGLMFHLKRIGANIADFFSSYQGVYKKYLAKLLELEKVPIDKNGAMKAEKLKDRSLARQLTINGFDANFDVAKKLMHTTETISLNSVKYASKATDMITTIHKQIVSGNYDLEKIFHNAKRLESELISGLPQKKMPNTAFDSTKNYGPFMGHQFLALGTEVFVDQYGGRHEYSFVSDFKGPSSSVYIDAIPAKSIKEAINVTKQFASTCLKSMDKDSLIVNSFSSLYDSIDSLVNEISSFRATNEEQANFKIYSNGVRKLLLSILMIVYYAYIGIPYICFRGYRAMVRYIDLSIQNVTV